MKTFQDASGRSWTVEITVQAIKRVRSLLPGIDLAQPDKGEPPLFVRLCDDPILLCDVLFCLIKPQADQIGLTDEQFGAGVGPEGLAAGVAALLEELADFFQRLGRRELAALIRKSRELQAAVIADSETRINLLAVDSLIPVTGN